MREGDTKRHRKRDIRDRERRDNAIFGDTRGDAIKRDRERDWRTKGQRHKDKMDRDKEIGRQKERHKKTGRRKGREPEKGTERHGDGIDRDTKRQGYIKIKGDRKIQGGR